MNLTLLHSCKFLSLVTELLRALDHSSNAFALAQDCHKAELRLSVQCFRSYGWVCCVCVVYVLRDRVVICCCFLVILFWPCEWTEASVVRYTTQIANSVSSCSSPVPSLAFGVVSTGQCDGNQRCLCFDGSVCVVNCCVCVLCLCCVC